MDHSSDAEKLHSMVLLLKMRAKSTDELTSIWTENDLGAWKDDEIQAARAVLLERLGKVPEQKRKAEDKPSAHAEKPDADDWFWNPFSERGWRARWATCLVVLGAQALILLLLYLLSLLFR